MPCYKFECSLTIKWLHSPGTWICKREDLFLVIRIFGTTKRTKLTEPIFPLVFNETFNYEKTFYNSCSAYDICSTLAQLPVTIELRQINDLYASGILLAYFDGNAKDLFAPCPTLYMSHCNNRELLMMRTIDFCGISPRVEFSTRAIIRPQSTCTYFTTHDLSQCCCTQRKQLMNLYALPSYSKPTVNSALRNGIHASQCVHENYKPENNSYYEKRMNGELLRESTINKSTENISGQSYGKSYSNLLNTQLPRRTKSSMDLNDSELDAAQERSDRYWHLYRFWQRELEQLRRSRMTDRS